MTTTSPADTSCGPADPVNVADPRATTTTVRGARSSMLIDHVPPPRQDPWRRTSGIHKAKGRRALAAVRELWTTRDQIASRRDIAPGRILPDAAIVNAATTDPDTVEKLLALPVFGGSRQRRTAQVWLDALTRARQDPNPPSGSEPLTGPPPRAAPMAAAAWPPRRPSTGRGRRLIHGRGRARRTPRRPPRRGRSRR